MDKDRSGAGRLFGLVGNREEDLARDWRDLPRSEMLGAAIVALDGAKAEAEEVGDGRYVRWVSGQIVPFLESELERAQREERRRPEG